MTLYTMELIAGLTTEMFGTKQPIFSGDNRTLGNYAIVEKTYFGFAIMVYKCNTNYGSLPCWEIADGFETEDARTMWHAVRKSLRRLKQK